MNVRKILQFESDDEIKYLIRILEGEKVDGAALYYQTAFKNQVISSLERLVK
jgi:hypothetical protein